MVLPVVLPVVSLFSHFLQTKLYIYYFGIFTNVKITKEGVSHNGMPHTRQIPLPA